VITLIAAQGVLKTNSPVVTRSMGVTGGVALEGGAIGQHENAGVRITPAPLIDHEAPLARVARTCRS